MSLSRPIIMGCGAAIVLAAGLAVSPALSAMSRADRIKETQLTDGLLGQFTPATGDPRLIARYARVSAADRQAFSFTPALATAGEGRRAITVVVRARRGDLAPAGNSAERTAALVATPNQPVAIAPVAYRLGSAVGFKKFATPQVGQPLDIARLPRAAAPVDRTDRPSRFATRLIAEDDSPAGATPTVINPDAQRTVDMTSSYRLSRNIDLTAGVRYRAQALPQSIDSRRDDQAVYVGTQFKF